MEESWLSIRPLVRSTRATATSCRVACTEVPAGRAVEKNLPDCAPCCSTIVDSWSKGRSIASLTWRGFVSTPPLCIHKPGASTSCRNGHAYRRRHCCFSFEMCLWHETFCESHPTMPRFQTSEDHRLERAGLRAQ